MPKTIRYANERERQALYNEHHASKVASGEYREVVETHKHPARGLWEWCTAIEKVSYYDKETNERLVLGFRHQRGGKILTKNGLDPKYVVYDDFIYTQDLNAEGGRD